MSDMRDARLQRALESAPDDATAPSARVAAAIQRRARQALEQDGALAPREAVALPWWKALWRASGSSSAPWNAAFATLVLVGFVTLMWQGSEIPGADPRESPAVPSAAPAAPAPPANPAPSAVERAAPQGARPEPSSAPATQAPAAAKARADRAEAPRETLAQQSAPPAADAWPSAFPAPPAAAPVAPPALSRPAAPPPPPAPAPAFTEQGMGRAAETEARNRQEAMPAPAREPQSRDAAAKAAAPALQRSAPAARAAAPAWETARIVRDGRVTELGRVDARRLAAAVRALIDAAAAAPASGGMATAAALRIELRASGGEVESLEIAGDTLRWTRRGGAGESAGTGIADAARLGALLSELDRVAPR